VMPLPDIPPASPAPLGTAAPTPLAPVFGSPASPSASAPALPSPAGTPGTGSPVTLPPTGSPSASAPPRALTLTVAPAAVDAGRPARVTTTSAPGAAVELWAYSRPGTTYRLVRRGTADRAGRAVFQVGPGGNTRLFARAVSGSRSVDSPSVVLQVRTAVSLRVSSAGPRALRFTGSTLPRRPGQLVTVYRLADGARVRTAVARVTGNGTWSVLRAFGTGGGLRFVAGTSTDLTNGGGTSRPVTAVLR
ncbi:MAG: hypothetical protein JWN57_839, partial [Frankiales bacterium]|nr:hypothetical protein [Frankiales bacterium]